MMNNMVETVCENINSKFCLNYQMLLRLKLSIPIKHFNEYSIIILFEQQIALRLLQLLLFQAILQKMENFEQIIRHASHLKQFQLKKDRQQYESLPNFLKNSLSYAKKYNRLRNQDFYVRMFTSDNIKRLGNDAVKENKFEEALLKYEEALSVFRYIETRTQQNIKDSDLTYFTYTPAKDKLEEEMFKKHMVSLYLNISLCLTKLNKKQESILSVKQAISIDKANAKCYYRLGQSYIKYINRTQEDVDEGIKCLEISYSLNKDQNIKKQIEKVKKEVEKQLIKSKKTFSFILNSNTLRDSTLSEKETKKILPQNKKERSRSAGKKPVVTKTQNIKPSNAAESNPAAEENKNILIQKQLEKINNMEEEKKIKTEEKLLKISYKQDWKIHLLQNFILTKGYKILSLIQIYGSNYKDYLAEYKTILNKCNVLYQKTNKKEQKFIDNEGQQVTLNFQDKETKEIVNEEKLKVYDQYIQWLRQHPIPTIKKYVQRLDNHTKFVEDKINERKKKSESVTKVFDNRREQNRKKNMKSFYVAIGAILLWLLYSQFRD